MQAHLLLQSDGQAGLELPEELMEEGRRSWREQARQGNVRHLRV